MDVGEPESLSRRYLRRQLEALEADEYEVGVFDRNDMTRRVWSAGKVLQSIRWLGYRNVKGAHVYLRPVGTSFVLVDDATEEGLLEMGRDGLAAAAVVETSPGNHQAWLRFESPLGREMATSVAQVVASKYACDPASADWRHLGRAVGFTNRKKKYRDAEGRYPWVRLVAASGVLTGGVKWLRREATAWTVRKDEERSRVVKAVASAKRGSRRSAVGFFEDEVRRVHGRFGGATDASRADAAAARKMALAGFSQSQVVRAIEAAESVAERKAGHVTDYALRTARWAFGKTRFTAR